MKTVGRRWPTAARGSNAASCDICGAAWRRDLMVRNADGLLACPDDQKGLVFKELDDGNAAGVRGPRRPPGDLGALFDSKTGMTMLNATATPPVEYFDASLGATAGQWVGQTLGMTLSTPSGAVATTVNSANTYFKNSPTVETTSTAYLLGTASQTLLAAGSFPWFVMVSRIRTVTTSQHRVVEIGTSDGVQTATLVYTDSQLANTYVTKTSGTPGSVPFAPVAQTAHLFAWGIEPAGYLRAYMDKTTDIRFGWADGLRMNLDTISIGGPLLGGAETFSFSVAYFALYAAPLTLAEVYNIRDVSKDRWGTP